MKKSATQLGREVSLTGQEMNCLFEKQGYLEGEPDNYSLTPKGMPFASEHEEHRGTGGYSVYNKYWTTRRWDETILDEMDVSEEAKEEARTAVSERRRQQREERKTESEAFWAQNSSCPAQEDEMTLDEDTSEFDGTFIGLAIGAGIGWLLYKVGPKVVAFARNKVVPKIKEKLSKKEEHKNGRVEKDDF